MSGKTKTSATKEDGKPALVPTLRFPDFRGGALRDVRLGDLTEESVNRNGHKHTVASVMGVTKADGIVPMEARLIAADIARYKLVQNDWFAYNPMRLNIGSIARWKGDNEILVSPDYVVFKCLTDDDSGINPAYLDHFRQTKAWEDFVTEGGDGSVRVRIYYKDIAGLRLALPSIPEQQKIAECLSSVDELIAAQARKVDALKTHKKGLMQQLFPREGETQPRLRFPEFQDAGAWTEGQLISLSSEPLSNGVFNDPKKIGVGYKLINVSDMYIDTTIDEDRLSLLELPLSDFEANQVIHGDIFFTRSSLVKSGIAVSNIYLGNSSDVTYDGHLIRFRPNASKVVPLFAHYLFKTALIRAQVIARGKSATMTTIGQADIASVILFYPEKIEQQRIADCLTSLDDLIVAQTQKLETLKTHKKGLMQQLFPSSAEAEA